jgi:hypothetical protein
LRAEAKLSTAIRPSARSGGNPVHSRRAASRLLSGVTSKRVPLGAGAAPSGSRGGCGPYRRVPAAARAMSSAMSTSRPPAVV